MKKSSTNENYLFTGVCAVKYYQPVTLPEHIPQPFKDALDAFAKTLKRNFALPIPADAEGHYAVLLGAMREDGSPQEVFTSNEARWLGAQVNQPGAVEQARVLLVSVPYALKAADAETLGGRPLSAFVLAPSADKSSTTSAAASDALPTAAVTVSGSGTNNQITKWLDGVAGTLTDSVIAESGGNIGIGTAAPAFKLDVASAVGNGSQSYIRINDTTADVTGGFYGGADATLIFGAQRAGFSEGAAGILDVTTNHPLYLKTNDQTRMTLLGGGNVGIGTATPAFKLDVASAVGNGSQSYIRINDTTADVTGGFYGGADATLIFGAQRAGFSEGASGILDVTTNHPLYLKTNDTTRMTILGDGNVGIGITSPTAKLDVVGDLKVSGNYIGTINSTGTLALPNTTDAATGVLTLGGSPFLHNFGFNNTFLGSNAGNFTTSGIGQNTGVGSSALEANTTGNHNTATGRRALASNTTGNWNTATGRSALASNTTGESNTAIGTNALQVNTTGNSNTATGTSALFATTGSNNTASGDGALEYNTTGSSNTAVGVQAGYTLSNENANTAGSNNTFLGAFSGPGVPSASGLTNATAIGANAVVSASNSLVLGSINGVNGATASVNVGIGTASPTAKLHVRGTDSLADGLAAAIKLRNDAAGGNGWTLRAGADGTNTPTGGFSIASDPNTYRFVIDGTGRVGIGTTSPTQQLEVNGGVRLNTATTKPTCDATTRGTFWVTQGGAGVADTVEVCSKDAADVYAWKTLL